MSNKILAFIDVEMKTVKAVDIKQKRIVGEYEFSNEEVLNQEAIDEILSVDYSIPFLE